MSKYEGGSLMKKTLIAALLFVVWLGVSVTVAAENAPTESQAESACGDFHTQFKSIRTSKDHPLAPAVNGMAQVYVIEEYVYPQNIFGHFGVPTPTIRVGMDGHWMGADQDNSYMFFSAVAGNHHLCVQWQSKKKLFSKEVSVFGFNAEPNHATYFLVRIVARTSNPVWFTLDLAPINRDEAMLLIAQYPHSVSMVEK